MLPTNPTQLQFAPPSRTKPAPLILVHDGGGTTFGYYSIGTLNRDVWAIHNPCFTSGTINAGGMDGMAADYLDLLENAGIKGQVFLGGWSLGGMLALKMVHLLQTENAQLERTEKKYGFTVKGIILMDTPYHIPWSKCPSVAKSDYSHLTPLVRKSMENCAVLLEDWELPVIEMESAGKWEVPPTVLVKCRESVGGETSNTGGGAKVEGVGMNGNKNSEEKLPFRIDLWREDRVLGWGKYQKGFVRGVVDVESSHYKMFEFSKMKELTQALVGLLRVLEGRVVAY